MLSANARHLRDAPRRAPRYTRSHRHRRPAGDDRPGHTARAVLREVRQEIRDVSPFGFATTTYDRAGEPCGPVPSHASRRNRSKRVWRRCAAGSSRLRLRYRLKKSAGSPLTNWRAGILLSNSRPVGVTVYELTLLGVEGTRARLRIRCSAGTYVRAIAHRLGYCSGAARTLNHWSAPLRDRLKSDRQ